MTREHLRKYKKVDGWMDGFVYFCLKEAQEYLRKYKRGSGA